MSEEKTKTAHPLVEARLKFGRFLQESREKAGYSIEELHHASKILPQFIEALEAGEFERLPGEVFVRGFSKSIARVIHCDKASLEQLIDAATDAKYAERLLVVQGSPGASTVRVGSHYQEPKYQVVVDFLKSLDRRIYFGAGALVLGLGLGYGAIVQIQRWANESDLSEKKVTLSQPEVKAPEVVVAEAPLPVPEAVVPAEPFVEIRVKSPVEIKVKVDQRGWEQTEYRPDSYKINFKDQVNLMVQDASAIEVFYNGRSIGNLGGKGVVRRLSFVAQGAVTDEDNGAKL